MHTYEGDITFPPLPVIVMFPAVAVLLAVSVNVKYDFHAFSWLLSAALCVCNVRIPMLTIIPTAPRASKSIATRTHTLPSPPSPPVVALRHGIARLTLAIPAACGRPP